MQRDEDDDDALHWEGDEQLGRATSLDRPTRPPRPRDAGAGTRADVTSGDPDTEPVPRDVPLAIATAVFAVLFLAETVGWILVVQGVQAAGAFQTGSAILDFLGGVSRFLTLLAAPLWFVSAFRLTSRRIHRIGWLSLGLGALVPWPLLLGFVL